MSLARASPAELSGFIEGLAQVPRTPGALQDFLREVRLQARRIRDIGWNIAVLAACKGARTPGIPRQAGCLPARALNAICSRRLPHRRSDAGAAWSPSLSN